MLATSGTCLWSFVTQVFRDGWPSRGGERGASTQPMGNSWHSSFLVINIVQILNISNLYISDVKNNTIISKPPLITKLSFSVL